MARKYDGPFVDNEMPYGRVPQGHPMIVDYFCHEEVRGYYLVVRGQIALTLPMTDEDISGFIEVSKELIKEIIY